jgi:hypothetical protein
MAEELPREPAPSARVDGPGFAELRRLGIALAQQLAGERWSDFNLHDPGVTLLEQICYALTDLGYRAGFDVADHLTAPAGQIDFQRQGLELPERVFPTRPTTVSDYRRIILDRVREVDDVRVNPLGERGQDSPLPMGLYAIKLRPRPGVGEGDLERIRQEVEGVFGRFRNLCEDVHETDFVRERDCELLAELEVERGRPPAEILAEVYHRCAEHLAARVRIHPFEKARRSGASLEEILSGPRCLHGFCDEEDLAREGTTFTVSELFSLISGIEGVDYASSLSFRVDGVVEYDAISFECASEALRLQIPTTAEEVGVRLSSHGRSLRVPFGDLRNALEAWALRGLADEPRAQDLRSLYEPPRGEYRDLGRYSSIQTQLPAVYGVGARRLPEHAPDGERARVRQLTAYLALFDQVMANCTADVAGLRDLYSRDAGGSPTYAVQLLEESQISSLRDVYPPRPAPELESVVADRDNVEERSGRLLDYLLALYGESFQQNSLRAFDLYGTARERRRGLVENKARFHRAIVALTRDRGGAMDYRAPPQTTVSGLQRRVCSLLGFSEHRCRSLTAVFLEQQLRPVGDSLSGDSDQDGQGPALWESDEVVAPEHPWQAEVPLVAPSAEESVARLWEQVGHLLPRLRERIGEDVLGAGASLGGYRLGHLRDANGWQAFLATRDERRWWRLAPFPSRAEAIEAVNRLRRLIVLLNARSEGMHVIEHILLRPRSQGPPGGTPSPAPRGFYPFRLTVAFPAWTARFQDRRFRQLACETVQLNCPAHIVPTVIGLGFDQMVELEQLQEQWLMPLSAGAAGLEEIDAASRRLTEFLLSRSRSEHWDLRGQGDSGQRSVD